MRSRAGRRILNTLSEDPNEMARKTTQVAGRRRTAATSEAGASCLHESDADGAAGGRKAVGVDADIKERNLKRLRRIEGQVRGLQRMVEDDRYCGDIMTQISSVHEALRSVGRELMRNHLKHCATSAIRSGAEEADAMYDELVEMMYRHSR